MRLRADERGRVATLVADIERWSESTRAILPHVLPVLHGLLDGEKTIAFGLDADERGVRLAFLDEAADYGSLRALIGDWFATAPVKTGFNAVAPEPWQRNVPLVIEDLRPTADPRMELFLPRIGLAGRDQLRLLVCDGASLLAWVGGFRPVRFGARERAILGALAEPLRRRLQLERELGKGSLSARALAVALDALGAAAFLLAPRGAVRHANAAGRELLGREGQVVRGELVACTGAAPPPRFRVSRLSASGLPDHFLAIAAAPPAAAARATEAASRWGLTARQTEVLRLVAEGVSNRDIAARLRCTTRTVEGHVSAILARAGVDTRAALTARVWSTS